VFLLLHRAGKPAEIVKYRAVEAFAGDDVSFEKGATLFIVGDTDANGMAQVSRDCDCDGASIFSLSRAHAT
jgi:hypothetical protein